MRWDYCGVSVWGLDQHGYKCAMKKLISNLGEGVRETSIKPRNGYAKGVCIAQGCKKIVSIFTHGSGSAQGSTFFEAASRADDVYPLLQSMFSEHGVARLDACQDFTGLTAWRDLEQMLTEICTRHKIAMSPSGEGHARPDGTRNPTKGRSWYCGGRTSQFRVVIYEKGKMNLEKGVPDDPNRVRLEVRVRPKSTAKRKLSGLKLIPDDLLGMSKWGLDLANKLAIDGIQRVNIGSIWRPVTDDDQLVTNIVRLFRKGIGEAMKNMSPEELGKKLCDEQVIQQTARDAIKALV